MNNFSSQEENRPGLNNIHNQEHEMALPEQMWQCQTVNCGYTYDPDRGDRKGKVPKGIMFEGLPDDWKCPVCGGGKKCFRSLAGPGSAQ